MQEQGGNAVGAALEKALHLRELKRFDLAERTLRETLSSFPNAGDLHLELAHVMHDQERDDEATGHVHDALRCNPDDGYALALLGEIAMAAGRNMDAEQHFLAALKTAPSHPGFLIQYAHLMFQVGQFDKAERLTRASLQQFPDNPGAHSMLSLILGERRKLSESQDAGATGLSMSPDNDVQHYSMGIAYYRSGRPRKARKHLREALRLDPDDPDTAELFEEVDLMSRWTAVPFYYWSLLCERIPGGPFAIWGIFVGSTIVMRSMEVSSDIVGVYTICYVLLMLYTWVATPITKLWMKLVPAR